MEIKKLSEVEFTDIDLILLDLDNTLYDYHVCHNYAMEIFALEFAHLFSINIVEVNKLYKAARQQVHIRHHGTAVSHSRLFYIQNMVEKINNNTSTETIISLYNLYWDSFLNKMKLFDDAILFLQRCMELKLPIVLVTDMTTEVQFKKIKKLGIEKHLLYIVTSEEAGIEKPHPFIFEYAINKVLRLNKAIKNIAVIGDDIKKDLHISETFAMHTFYINRNG